MYACPLYGVHFTCTYFLLLDFCAPFHCFNVQSATLARSFWTSSVHSSASTSNPPRNFFPFGLPLCIPLLQRPIRRSFSSLLDFLRVFHYFNVQSAAQLLNCTPCQGHYGYNYLPNFYPANKGFIPVFVY